MTELLTMRARVRTALACGLLCSIASMTAPDLLPAQQDARSTDTLRLREGGATRVVAPQSSITIGFTHPIRDLGTDSAVPRVRITPIVPVRLTWRDPVTLRVTPLQPLVPGERYTIVVDTPLVATNGARLVEPATVIARVPEVVRRSTRPALRGDTSTMLAPHGRVTLFVSGQVDSARWARAVTVRLEGDARCTANTHAYRLVRQRLPVVGEPVLDRFVREINGVRRTDTLTRVLEFAPDDELPSDCSGVLTLHGSGATAVADSFRVRTTPAFALWPLPACGGAPCAAQQMVRLDFSTPLAEAHRSSLRVEPESLPRAVRWISPTAVLVRTRADPGESVRVEVPPTVRDVYGRALAGAREWTVRVPDRQPAVSFGEARFAIWPRRAHDSVRVHHINASVVELRAVRVAPRAFTARARSVARGSLDPLGEPPLETIGDTITVRHRVSAPRNSEGETRLPLPEPVLLDANHAWHVAVQLIDPMPEVRFPPSLFATRDSLRVASSAFVLARSNMMVHAQLTGAPSAVFVTAVPTGVPLERVAVTLLDSTGQVLATAHTGADGTATLALASGDAAWTAARNAARLLQVAREADTLRIPLVESDWLLPRQAGFKVPPSWARYSGSSPYQRSLAFTDRDLYRAGERLYFGVMQQESRDGRVRFAHGDSVRWHASYFPTSGQSSSSIPIDSGYMVLGTVGTAADSLRLPATLPPAYLSISLWHRRDGGWREMSGAAARVAEYRTPEFLLNVSAPPQPPRAEPESRFLVDARYLYDAPMAGAIASWSLDLREADDAAGLLRLPASSRVGPWDARRFGVMSNARDAVTLERTDTLDDAGQLLARQRLESGGFLRPVRAELDVTVTDVNRQNVSASQTAIVHPSAYYLVVSATSHTRPPGDSVRVAVRAQTPTGEPVRGRRVQATLVHWHGDPPANTPQHSSVVVPIDTVWQRTLRTRDHDDSITVVLPAAGVFELAFTSTDARGHPVRTSIELIGATPSITRAAVDRASLLRVPSEEVRRGESVRVEFDSPYPDAEAWLTLEHEGVLWQWRQRVPGGTHAVQVPTARVVAPGAYVSLLLVPRADASALTIPREGEPTSDPATERWHFASATLRVGALDARLALELRATRDQWRPGDTAEVAVRVRDRDGRAAPAVLTVWAVDEGQLSLGQYTGPDPHATFTSMWSAFLTPITSLTYLSPGYGVPATLAAMRLAWFEPYSPPWDFNGRGLRGGFALSQVVSQPGVPEAMIRDDMRATAFFVANAHTDADGLAVIRASLPQTITRYRLFAVAGDSLGRTGRDTSSLQVTIPLVVRAALPRFVRPGDDFSAGAVVAIADGQRRSVRVDASAIGLVTPDSIRNITAETKAREVRFSWTVPARDSTATADTAQLVLRATARDLADAVRTRVPVEDARRPLIFSRGMPLGQAQQITMRISADVDLARSQMQLRVGHPARTAIDVARARLGSEPYDALVPLASHLSILAALPRSDVDSSERRTRGERLATRLTQRMNRDGGMRYWTSSAWTTPWLSAHAGLVLLDARAAGIRVDSAALESLRRYLASARVDSLSFAYGLSDERANRLARAVTSDLARAQFLRRMGAPDSTLETALHAQAEALPWEALPTLADLLLRAGRRNDAIATVERAWSRVQANAGSLQLPEPRTGADVPSSLRGPATLVAITRVLRPTHPLLPALEAQVLETALGAASTHDLAYVAATFAAEAPRSASARLMVSLGDGSQPLDTLLAARASLGAQQWSDASRTLILPLARYVRQVGDSLELSVRVASNDAPYAQLTVFAEPARATERPMTSGITVERWIERIRDGAPITQLAAGELVRVVLRVRTDASREFLVLEDALPAGLEVIDPSLRTAMPWTELADAWHEPGPEDDAPDDVADLVGSARGTRWPVWMHRELRDDVVRFHARLLWPGTHTVSYLARATTPGRFVRPSAFAEQMFDAGIYGRSEAGVLLIRMPEVPR